MSSGRGIAPGASARLVAAVATSAAAIACAGLPALARAGQPAAPEVVSAAVEQGPSSVRDYWNNRRMRRAEPADLIAAGGGRLSRATVARANAAPQRSGPATRAAVDASASSSAFPARVHGKVFFTIAGGSDPGDFVCSGTVVGSNSHTLVWTAGHCVDDAEFGGALATNWIFVPGYRNGEQPFGSWPAARLLTTAAWADDVNVRQDLGVAQLARDGEGRGIEDLTGAREIVFNQSRTQQYTAFGYPAEPSLFEPLFDGERLYTCTSPVTGSDNPPGKGPETLEIACDMTGGASGGGWVDASGAVDGLTSYGYTGDLDHLYGPYFGSFAHELYTRASGPALLCSDVEVTNLGAAGADRFAGTAGVDAFRLAGGDDRASGGDGDDAACGGGGADRLTGGDGLDTLRGGAGGDLLDGGRGVDLCIGGPGHDRARGCERRRQIP